MKNILFSTTRQWNPGDEFILMGILEVLNRINPNFNPIIFNRNPEIYHEAGFVLEIGQGGLVPRLKRLKQGSYDNSFKRSLTQTNFIDTVIFAGTPEWGSPRLKILYEYIDRFSIPTFYLGIGLGADLDLNTLDKIYLKVLGKAKLITVRDPSAKDKLASFNPLFLPCPALLAAPKDRERRLTKVSKIGLIYGMDQSVRNNSLKSDVYDFMKRIYKGIMEKYAEKYQFEFISHYANELAAIKNDFASYPVHYSYNSSDYLKIYQQFDFVIGPRVHGIGISASMGIPGINLAHDMRAETCKGFGAEIISVENSLEEVLALIDKNIKNIGIQNAQLLEHKWQIFDRYKSLLSTVI